MLNDWYKIAYQTHIRTKLPGLNEYVDAERSHRQSAARIKRLTQADIMWFLDGSVKFDKPVYVQFTWHEKISANGQCRDMDNVAFAKKFIFDALQQCGMLVNDNYKYVKGFSDEFIYGKDEEYGVEVTVFYDEG